MAGGGVAGRATRGLASFGRNISYPFYLWHVPVLGLIVAAGWTGYVVSLLKDFGVHIPAAISTSAAAVSTASAAAGPSATAAAADVGAAIARSVRTGGSRR